MQKEYELQRKKREEEARMNEDKKEKKNYADAQFSAWIKYHTQTEQQKRKAEERRIKMEEKAKEEKKLETMEKAENNFKVCLYMFYDL